MKKSLMKKKCLLVFTAAVISVPTFAQLNVVKSKVNALVSREDMKAASLSFAIKDVSNGELIYGFNERKTMPTASTVKLFTTATTLLTYGPDYSLTTPIYINGPIINGVLKGDLIIRGAGDPSLGSKYFFDEQSKDAFMKEWLKAVLDLNIRTIEGDVIADGSSGGYEGVPDGWTWNDMGNYYGAGPSGCTVYDNLLRLTFSSSRIGELTRLKKISPDLPNVSFQNFVRAARSNRDNAYVYGAPFQENRYVRGEIPYNRTSFEVKASVPDPEYLMAHSLKLYLEANGVGCKGDVNTARNLMDHYDFNAIYKNDENRIGQYRGKNLVDIAYWTNHKSVNLFAEQLLTWLGRDEDGNTSISAGVGAINYYWKEKIDANFKITDGSGLSRSNSLSARHFVDMLGYVAKHKYFSDFLKTIPVVGQSGTVKYLCRNEKAQGRIHAKSGSISGVKSYAGYVSTESGKQLAFSITANNYACSTSTLVNYYEAIFNAMAEM